MNLEGSKDKATSSPWLSQQLGCCYNIQGLTRDRFLFNKQLCLWPRPKEARRVLLIIVSFKLDTACSRSMPAPGQAQSAWLLSSLFSWTKRAKKALYKSLWARMPHCWQLCQRSLSAFFCLFPHWQLWLSAVVRVLNSMTSPPALAALRWSIWTNKPGARKPTLFPKFFWNDL